MKNFIKEISEVTWISGRQLTVDTGYILMFSGILLVYFTLVDGILTGIVKNFIAG